MNTTRDSTSVDSRRRPWAAHTFMSFNQNPYVEKYGEHKTSKPREEEDDVLKLVNKV